MKKKSASILKTKQEDCELLRIYFPGCLNVDAIFMIVIVLVKEKKNLFHNWSIKTYISIEILHAPLLAWKCSNVIYWTVNKSLLKFQSKSVNWCNLEVLLWLFWIWTIKLFSDHVQVVAMKHSVFVEAEDEYKF
jgi:hypothetical protein